MMDAKELRKKLILLDQERKRIAEDYTLLTVTLWELEIGTIARKMIGRFFKFKNINGDEEWWSYVHILEMQEHSFMVALFEILPSNKRHILTKMELDCKTLIQSDRLQAIPKKEFESLIKSFYKIVMD